MRRRVLLLGIGTFLAAWIMTVLIGQVLAEPPDSGGTDGEGSPIIFPTSPGGSPTLTPCPGCVTPAAVPMQPDFTYQGQLKRNGTPINDRCDLQFTLYNDESGPPIAGPLTRANVLVADGQLNATLDFPRSYLTGEVRWLGIAVRCPAGSGDYISLTPRRPLTAAPFAISLVPGARIEGSVSSSGSATESSILTVSNSDPYGGGIYGAGPLYGVLGENSSPSLDYAGVLGRGGLTGVRGEATLLNGNGVVGVANNGSSAWGVLGESNTGVGLLGRTNQGIGVSGLSSGLDGFGGSFTNRGDGVALAAEGSGSGRDKAALEVNNYQSNGGLAAVLTNKSDAPTAHLDNNGAGEVLHLQNAGTDPNGTGGGDFITAVNQTERGVQFRVTSAGQVRAAGGIGAPGAGLAEWLPAERDLEPGDVLVFGQAGKLTLSTRPYQTSVAGVYATQPAFLSGQPVQEERLDYVPLAVVGIVPVKAVAQNGPISPGDLLTTSEQPGRAMRADEKTPAGAILGKAVSGLRDGAGVIQMLVVLR